MRIQKITARMAQMAIIEGVILNIVLVLDVSIECKWSKWFVKIISPEDKPQEKGFTNNTVTIKHNHVNKRLSILSKSLFADAACSVLHRTAAPFTMQGEVRCRGNDEFRLRLCSLVVVGTR